MRSASLCRAQAKECRALAKDFDRDRRQQILGMAETWDDLARQVDADNNRHLTGMIRATYDKVASEPVPDRLRELLGRLDAKDWRERGRQT
jgi:hypothetical protein